MTTAHVQLEQILRSVAELSDDFAVEGSQELVADLGIDSLALIDVVLAVEQEFSIELSEEALVKAKTVDQLLSEIERAAAA